MANKPSKADIQAFVDAAIQNDAKTLQRLHGQFGANIINQPNKEGESALHAAVYAEQEEAVKFLVKNGADIAQVNKKTRETPIALAARLASGTGIKRVSQAIKDILVPPSAAARAVRPSTNAFENTAPGSSFLGSVTRDTGVVPNAGPVRLGAATAAAATPVTAAPAAAAAAPTDAVNIKEIRGSMNSFIGEIVNKTFGKSELQDLFEGADKTKIAEFEAQNMSSGEIAVKMGLISRDTKNALLVAQAAERMAATADKAVNVINQATLTADQKDNMGHRSVLEKPFNFVGDPRDPAELHNAQAGWVTAQLYLNNEIDAKLDSSKFLSAEKSPADGLKKAAAEHYQIAADMLRMEDHDEVADRLEAVAKSIMAEVADMNAIKPQNLLTGLGNQDDLRPGFDAEFRFKMLDLMNEQPKAPALPAADGSTPVQDPSSVINGTGSPRMPPPGTALYTLDPNRPLDAQLLRCLNGIKQVDKQCYEALAGNCNRKESKSCRSRGQGFQVNLATKERVDWLNSAKGSYIEGPKPGRDGRMTKASAEAMVAMAKMRGWETIRLHGNEHQMDMMWVAAQKMGLTVENHKPDEKSAVYRAYLAEKEAAARNAQASADPLAAAIAPVMEPGAPAPAADPAAAPVAPVAAIPPAPPAPVAAPVAAVPPAPAPAPVTAAPVITATVSNFMAPIPGTAAPVAAAPVVAATPVVSKFTAAPAATADEPKATVKSKYIKKPGSFTEADYKKALKYVDAMPEDVRMAPLTWKKLSQATALGADASEKILARMVEEGILKEESKGKMQPVPKAERPKPFDQGFTKKDYEKALQIVGGLADAQTITAVKLSVQLPKIDSSTADKMLARMQDEGVLQQSERSQKGILMKPKSKQPHP